MLDLLSSAGLMIQRKEAFFISSAINCSAVVVQPNPTDPPLSKTERGECANYLISWVNKSLGEYASLSSWLMGNHPIDRVRPETLDQTLLQTKLEWVSWMYRELVQGR